MMILYLLENPEKADHQIEAVHDEADADEAYQCELLIAQRLSERPFDVSEVSDGTEGTTNAAVPGDGGRVGARNCGGEEIVEAQGEGGGPCADGEDFRQSVGEFCRSAPESEWPTKIFKLYQ